MENKKSKSKKPLIGFFPLCYNLAETGRALLVAKEYKKVGGDVIFFSHGGEYEKIIRKNDFKILSVKPKYSKDFIDDLWKYSRIEKIGAPFSEKQLEEHIESEIKAYKKTKVKLIVSTNNFPCVLSARIAKIPLISITPKVRNRFSVFPEDANLKYTKIIPKKIKLRILNYYFPNSKIWSKPFDDLAKKYKTKRVKNSADLVKGDYTFYTDFAGMHNIRKNEVRSNEYYIGPIFLDKLFGKTSQKIEIEEDVKKQFKKPGKKILLTLGSSGTKKLFIDIIKKLNKTNYNTIAIYSSILKENDLPKTNENILLKKFVKSIWDINKKVDLVIMHGGQGTVYTAAYSGKPVIGFPMQLEQHQNLELLLNKGMAKILYRKHANEKIFLDAIKDIFENYSSYYQNAQNLSKSLHEPKGEINAINQILKIIKKENIR